MKNIKKFLWICLSVIFLTGAIAATKQVLGPTTPTTANAIALWADTTSYKLINSLVTIDLNGNLSGVSTQQMTELESSFTLTTNGVLYLQQSSAPTAAFIGGTVGSVTNHLLRNVNGIWFDYWSDGTTLWGPKQIAP